jgi:hypothetical protein
MYACTSQPLILALLLDYVGSGSAHYVAKCLNRCNGFVQIPLTVCRKSNFGHEL